MCYIEHVNALRGNGAKISKGKCFLLEWEIRVISLLTNLFLLIGYTVLFNWIQTAKFPENQRLISRTLLLIISAFGFLIFFHWSSLTGMAEYRGVFGYGWVFMNFQILVVAYAMLRTKRPAVFYSLAVLITIWYWWLPRVKYWYVLDVATLLLMWAARLYGRRIFNNFFLYYLFISAFAVPVLYANYLSLSGIDCGWPWQISTYLLLSFGIREVELIDVRIRKRQASLLEEAQVDELTQLFNFRVFNDDLQTAYTSFANNKTPYALFTFDIDHFKHVNDHYGHLMGNRVLEQVARQLQRSTGNLKHPVKCYRTGGEEFSFLVFDIERNFEDAHRVAKQICDDINQIIFTTDDGHDFSITISLGEDAALSDDQNYLDLYNRADKYLYTSKRSGRSRMTIRGITVINPRPSTALN